MCEVPLAYCVPGSWEEDMGTHHILIASFFFFRHLEMGINFIEAFLKVEFTFFFNFEEVVC